MKKFSIGLVCALFFGAVFGGTGTLVYHCTFDSVAAVENPEVGPSGTCWYSVFVQGIEGNALSVPMYEGAIRVPFVDGLPAVKGCLEFWAKISPNSDSFGSGGNPRFFAFNKFDSNEEHVAYLELNANNGLGKGGWCVAFSTAYQVTGTCYGAMEYSTFFGERDFREWHRYTLRWNMDGLESDRASVFVFELDGDAIMKTAKGSINTSDFIGDLSQPLELFLPVPQVTRYPGDSRVPFLIDEFKVWNSDVTTGGTDDPDPGPGTDPTVEPTPMPGGCVCNLSFDSVEAIVAAGGQCEGATFADGVNGKALYVSGNDSGVVRVMLDHGLPVEKGAISFSAKILTESLYYAENGNPRFFTMLPQKRTGHFPWIVTLDINANNGAGKSGWDLVLGGPNLCSFDTFSMRQPYVPLFPKGDYTAWHQYELCWNLNGIDGTQNAIAFYLDGKLMLSCTKDLIDEAYFRRHMAEPLELVFPCPKGAGMNVTPFLIDEFKIWDSDVIGSDVPDPTVDPTPVVSDDITVGDVAARYEAGMEIAPVAVAYTGVAEKAKLAVTGLPEGLVFKNGAIAGAPELPGVYTVSATVKAGRTVLVSKTFTLSVANYRDALASGLADAYGPFIPGEPLVLDLVSVAGWKAERALPTGLKFDAKTGRITGTPKKPGVYPLVFTKKIGYAQHAASTVLTISTLREVVLSTEGEGTVKGAGTYLANARVTLSAKAAKGFAFLGWYKGEERMSRDASYAYLVGADEKQTLVAKFVTVEEDRASLTAALAETALDAAEVLVVTNYQGVAVSLPLACDALTKPTASVSGLPSGLAFKNGTITGASSTASTLDKKTGLFKPKTTTVVVKTLGGTTMKYPISFVTLPRPAWAVGSFDGVFAAAGVPTGSVTATLAASGRLSGKLALVVDGKAVTATLTAASLAAYDPAANTFQVTATCVAKKIFEETVTFTLAARETAGTGLLTAGDENATFVLAQNIWKEKTFTAPTFPTGKSVLALTLEDGLALKFGAKGAVTFAGKLAGEGEALVSVSGSAQLVITDEGKAAVVVYVAPKKGLSSGYIREVPIDFTVNEVGQVEGIAKSEER